MLWRISVLPVREPGRRSSSPARPSRRWRIVCVSFRLRRLQAFVNGFDELVRLDEAVALDVLGVVVERRPGGLNLFEGHVLADHGANAVANDDHHVAVFYNVGFVTQPAVTGDDVGAAFLSLSWNGEIQDVVERVDFAGDAAAPFDVNERI